ncbi:MAG: ABC-three component system protein [Nanoarchaeota archaeon]
MRDYQIYSLSKEGFENLIYHVCKELLGEGVVNFAEGPDGGRDAKFEGEANKFPGENSSWDDLFIIQAKGGGNAGSLCSSSQFGKVIEKEIERIKKLCETENIKNYLIFTSRKLGGNTESLIVQKIKDETGIENVWIGGREFITEHIAKYPEIVRICNLPKYLSPLIIHPQEIKKVIEKFGICKEEISEGVNNVSKKEYIKKDKKNKLNNLSEEYFDYIKRSSLVSFKKIDKFLADPKNNKFKESYLNSADELQSKITIRREEFDKFEEVFEEIYDILLARCSELQDNGRLVNVFLHHMYWNCKLGRTE